MCTLHSISFVVSVSPTVVNGWLSNHTLHLHPVFCCAEYHHLTRWRKLLLLSLLVHAKTASSIHDQSHSCYCVSLFSPPAALGCICTSAKHSPAHAEKHVTAGSENTGAMVLEMQPNLAHLNKLQFTVFLIATTQHNVQATTAEKERNTVTAHITSNSRSSIQNCLCVYMWVGCCSCQSAFIQHLPCAYRQF